ncbi:MAG TPA: hypothetical protein VJS44_04770 [Pyrinomonadaceae bacterium]|nr:hypothetical protein [Pyrinomonadaceae bacterium]
MLNIQHPEIFEQTIESAKHATLGSERWIHAIERAVEEITEHPERFHWAGTHMLIFSPTSDEVYEASDRNCFCTAYEFHRPCKHRAAARIWQLYTQAVRAHEWQQTPGKPVQPTTQVSISPNARMDNAVLASSSHRPAERVKGIRI